MPKAHGVGYSADYPEKQAYLREYTSAMLGIAREVGGRQAWAWPGLLILDLNAGDGGINGTPGSPLILLDVALALRPAVPVRAFFFEQQRGNCQRLANRLDQAGYPRDTWRVVQGDNGLTVPQILATAGALPAQKCYGLVYADPNGMLPYQALLALAHDRRFRFVDFLLRPSAQQYKRVASLKPGGQSPIRQRETMLDAELPSLGKTRFAVSKPTHTTWQHTWILATHLDALVDRLATQLAPVGTPEGNQRWQNTVYSRSQLQAQVQLQFPARRAGEVRDAALSH